MRNDDYLEVPRQQLYDEVWSDPVLKVSQRYWLSDVGLKKICKRHNIPTPPLGYWAKRNNGRKVIQTKLPEMTDEKPVRIKTLLARIGKEDPELPDRVARMIAFEKRKGTRIIVPDTLENPRPSIVEASKELRTTTKGYQDLYWVGCERYCGIATSKELIPRALHIMDTLLKALEQRGLLEEGVFGRRLTFWIREKIHSEVTEQGRERMREAGKKQCYYKDHFDRYPSGRLSLVISRPRFISCDRLQQSWTDGNSQRIEDCLNEFICGLIYWSALDYERDLEREREDFEREEKRKRAEQTERRKILVRARQIKLLSEAREYDNASILRKYIDAVIQTQGPVKSGSQLAVWIHWANREADRLDPLT